MWSPCACEIKFSVVDHRLSLESKVIVEFLVEMIGPADHPMFTSGVLASPLKNLNEALQSSKQS